MDKEEFDSTQAVDLGPCCACRLEKPDVRNLMMIHKLAPVPGTGWGNVLYGWPSNGALAVLCDECAEKGAPLLDAITGYPSEKQRVLFESLQGEFGNDAPPDSAIHNAPPSEDDLEWRNWQGLDDDDEAAPPIVLYSINEDDEVTGMVELSPEQAEYVLRDEPGGGEPGFIPMPLEHLMASYANCNYRYILEDGLPVLESNLIKWAMWIEQHRDEMIVGYEECGDLVICTVFLGLDMAYGQEPAQLYETMVFKGTMAGDTKRYSTPEQARAGHQQAVKWARFVQSEGGETT